MTALDKARQALEAVNGVLADAEPDRTTGGLQLRDLENVNRLLHVATAQANIAQAEALQKLANLFDGRLP